MEVLAYMLICSDSSCLGAFGAERQRRLLALLLYLNKHTIRAHIMPTLSFPIHCQNETKI